MRPSGRGAEEGEGVLSAEGAAVGSSFSSPLELKYSYRYSPVKRETKKRHYGGEGKGAEAVREGENGGRNTLTRDMTTHPTPLPSCLLDDGAGAALPLRRRHGEELHQGEAQDEDGDRRDDDAHWAHHGKKHTFVPRKTEVLARGLCGY